MNQLTYDLMINNANAPIPVYLFSFNRSAQPSQNEIFREFENKPEFQICSQVFFSASDGGHEFLHLLKRSIQKAILSGQEKFILCLDTHKFTNHYRAKVFLNSVRSADKKKADILSGGSYWSANPIPLTKNLIWVEDLKGIQFIVIYGRSYEKLLRAELMQNDVDPVRKIFAGAISKMILHPFISRQQNGALLDIAQNKPQGGQTYEQILKRNADCLNDLVIAAAFYKKILKEKTSDQDGGYEDISIPTYIINLPERKDRLRHIRRQFKDRTEFDCKIVEACRHKIGAVGLWESIKKAVGLAQQNDDDVIVICEDDHQFSKGYNRADLVRNVIEAHQQGADVLLGGFGEVMRFPPYRLPVGKGRFWINYFIGTQFMIIYKKFFQTILNASYTDTVMADYQISVMTKNIMTVYPFISKQRSFGYSDVTRAVNNDPVLLTSFFKNAENRLGVLAANYQILATNDLIINSCAF